MSGFTSGVWVADDNEGFSYWTIWQNMSPTGNGKCGELIASVCPDRIEDEANARLIAAAPTMYEAGMRVTKAFKALGLSSVVGEPLIRIECEQAMTALADALAGASHG